MNKPNVIDLETSLNVLFIEDNEDSRNQSIKLFENFFSSISAHENAELALDDYINYFKNTNSYYDFVITDINLPKMNGITLSQKILEINPEQEIIVISSYDDSDKLQGIIDLGITNYLKKPIDFDSFINTFSKAYNTQLTKIEKSNNLKAIEALNQELDAMMNSFDKYVIASRTDKKGVITYASKAYEIVSGYSSDELIGKPHNIVRHPDMPKAAFKDMWETIKSGKVWIGEVKNRKKDGSSYWVKATVGPYYDRHGTLLGYSAIREDITAKKEVEKLHEQVNDLLNNAGQGFLSFNKDFIISNGYSQECISIFNQEIANLNISELLFFNDSSKKDLFEYGISGINDEEDLFAKELLLSLLPKKHTLKDRDLELDFKLISNNKFMLIITDVTLKNALEKQLIQQQQIQKMIVAVVSDKDEFKSLKNDFVNFVTNIQFILKQTNPISDVSNKLKRELHTYKGLFAQKECFNIVTSLHNLESNLASFFSNENGDFKGMIQTFLNANLLKEFDKDLEKLSKTLGEDFLDEGTAGGLRKNIINSLEHKVLSIAKNINEEGRAKYEDLLTSVYHLTEDSLKEMLSSYPKLIKQLSLKLEKPVYDFTIEGEESLFLAKELRPFIKSLIHIFRNSIDHGIEDEETRLKRGKDPIGTIKCNYRKIDDYLRITIEDDGNGIDINSIKNKAIEKNIYTENEVNQLTDNQIMEIIFHEDFSTAKELTELSGRGVGLDAIKIELEQIKGKYEIVNTPTKGLVFNFDIPLDHAHELDEHILAKNILKQITARVNNFLINDMQIEVIGHQNEFINHFEGTNYTSGIGIMGDFNSLATFSFDKELIEKLGDVFVPKGFSLEEEIEMKKEIPAEVANIVLGLALQSLPNSGEDFSITAPMLLNKDELDNSLKNAISTIALQVKTPYGNLTCALIDRRVKRR